MIGLSMCSVWCGMLLQDPWRPLHSMLCNTQAAGALHIAVSRLSRRLRGDWTALAAAEDRLRGQGSKLPAAGSNSCRVPAGPSKADHLHAPRERPAAAAGVDCKRVRPGRRRSIAATREKRAQTAQRSLSAERCRAAGRAELFTARSDGCQPIVQLGTAAWGAAAEAQQGEWRRCAAGSWAAGRAAATAVLPAAVSTHIGRRAGRQRRVLHAIDG
jgi:hypothetical protein